MLNETADFYRFFDATSEAEFLYSCVQQAIDEDLPREAQFLARYGRFRGKIEGIVDMPNRMTDLLFRFVHNNGGKLSRRAQENEFSLLTPEEIAAVEAAWRDSFSPQ